MQILINKCIPKENVTRKLNSRSTCLSCLYCKYLEYPNSEMLCACHECIKKHRVYLYFCTFSTWKNKLFQVHEQTVTQIWRCISFDLFWDCFWDKYQGFHLLKMNQSVKDKSNMILKAINLKWTIHYRQTILYQNWDILF